MPDPFQFYGVQEFSETNSQTALSAEEIRVSGFTILPGVLTEAELETIRQKFDEIYQLQLNEIDGEERLREINDTNNVRILLAYDEYFLHLAMKPPVLAVVEQMLGSYYILMQQNGIINPPDIANYQISWHRDLPYQHFVCSRPLAVSALFCIDDFSEASGGTFVLPASHKIEAFPTQQYFEKHQVGISAKAGSVLIFDSMLYHRAGYNRSRNTRRALNHVYTLPFIKQQISLPDALQGKYRDDAFLAKFLGYESEPGKSLTQWREAKITRMRRQTAHQESSKPSAPLDADHPST